MPPRCPCCSTARRRSSNSTGAVLAQARRADVPLLERLRYICIVSSNMDEFFEVRLADYIEAARQPGTGVVNGDLESVASQAHALIVDQYKCFNDEVMPALQARRHRRRQPRRARQGAAALGRRVLPGAGAAAAGAGRAGSGASVSAGGQQVAQLHRAPRRQGRLRARELDRHRQGAARAAARDATARQARGRQAGLRAADERDPRPSGGAVPGASRRGVLAVQADRAIRNSRSTRRTSRTCARRCARA